MKNGVLIGVGMVAQTHASAFADSDKVNLYGVMASRAQRATAFASTYAEQHDQPVPKVFETVEDIAADPQVDFVCICTPPNARLPLVEVLADAGKPILMEKPIERTAQAAEAIVTRCEDAGVPLGIVLQHRTRESSQLLAELLVEGVLGDLSLIEISVPWWRPQGYYDEPGRGSYARDGGGVMISQAIHTLDLALMLAGPVQKVQALASTTKLHQMESEDVVTAGMIFENGAVGNFYGTTASYPGGSESITLHGTKASATLKDGQLLLNWQDGLSEILGTAAGTGGGANPMAFTHDWHQAILEDFADAIDQSRAPIASGRDALQVHTLIKALTLSSQLERAITLSKMDEL